MKLETRLLILFSHRGGAFAAMTRFSLAKFISDSHRRSCFIAAISSCDARGWISRVR